MSFTSGSTLLDTVVLAVVSKEGTYGYKITQDVRSVIDISESTLYPVLRRLLKDGMLETYDIEVDGRNRRYYKITSNGMIKLDEQRNEWKNYVEQINLVLFGNKKI
jgi:PadR family transcriptional regulator PadR